MTEPSWLNCPRSVLAACALVAAVAGTAVFAEPPVHATPKPPAKWPYGDPLYTEPYIDVDEWRDYPRRHRYVHGGFKGTDLRFSGYFLPQDRYHGRFFQYMNAGYGGSEHGLVPLTGASRHAKALDDPFSLGGYVIETNLGHLGDMKGVGGDGTLLNYRANAASARYLRAVAKKMYGAEPKYGYAYGVASRTVKGLENVDDVWQGGLAFQLAVPSGTIPVTMNAFRVLAPRLNDIIDAVEPGGSGNPFDGLSYPQREALAELYRSGYPRGSELDLQTLVMTGNMYVEELQATDPSYFNDFWNQAGYIGHDNPSALGKPLRRTVRIKQILTLDEINRYSDPDPAGMKTILQFTRSDKTAPMGLLVQGLDPSESYRSVRLRFKNGGAKGRALYSLGNLRDILLVTGPLLRPQPKANPFQGVSPGDEVELDDRDYIAASYHGPHELVPHYANLPVGWPDAVNGIPVHVKRTFVDMNMKLMPSFTGSFRGKLIVMPGAHDAYVPPVHGETYRRMVQDAQGSKAEEHFRLWWVEHGHHLPPAASAGPGVRFSARTRSVDVEAFVKEGLRSLVDWVEKGKSPPPTSGYSWGADNGLTLSGDPATIGGVQPLVNASVAGADRIEVQAGQPVTLEFSASLPAGSELRIVAAAWDFDGSGAFATPQAELPRGSSTSGKITHVFEKPGTYFPAVRVEARRPDERQTDPRPANVDWVRVVVH